MSLQRCRYPWDYDVAVYSPDVLVIRSSVKQGHELLPPMTPVTELPVVSVISVAAIRDPPICTLDEGAFSDDSQPSGGVFSNPSDRKLTQEKMRLALRIAAHNGHRFLVLGALGCGDCENPSDDVALCWAEVLDEDEFRGGWWQEIRFAVLDPSGDGHYESFERVLAGPRNIGVKKYSYSQNKTPPISPIHLRDPANTWMNKRSSEEAIGYSSFSAFVVKFTLAYNWRLPSHIRLIRPAHMEGMDSDVKSEGGRATKSASREDLESQSDEIFELGPARSQNGHGCADISDKEENGDPFEVSFDGDDDPLCPRSMNTTRKWLLVCIVGLGSLCVTCTSSIYTATYSQMNPEFHQSEIVATLGLSTFVLGIALGPLFLGPLSEFYGRRPIYLISWTMFVVWVIPSAVAHNSATIITTRFINGFVGSAFLSVAGGTVSDVFRRDQIQSPMTIISLSPFIGPSLGPLVGGFINYYTNWRWTYYVIIIWAFALLVLIFFFAPETYHPIKLREKARRMREETGDERWKAPSAASNPVWHSVHRRLVKKNHGVSEPEFRLASSILGAVMVPIGLFWFAWTSLSHWILPIIGSGIFGCGTLLVFNGVFTFLVDTYPLYAASALAANSFLRCSFAGKSFVIFAPEILSRALCVSAVRKAALPGGGLSMGVECACVHNIGAHAATLYFLPFRETVATEE
ncbi:hypothetical protein NPX13_g9254 [Xylaria arbuscula]|uniref:Major facilitator superfamily (MFS) profile domain-containing protein n=1 Tax=Xylaria arbuscula TaxID=114810 RepID=A0A9W8N7B5_9PEZI|nr:hypothetical protein NPX13_g9254 [Xylaria arbuscula]